jgi:sugar-specific transcriptional regulator TrmB
MTITLNEDTKLLMQLGLTELQAEIYFALAKMDKATLRSLSAASKIDRANVYRVMARLQELNLVEKFLSTPTIFRALPVSEGIKMLLDRREVEHNEIKAKTKDLLSRYKQVGKNASVEEVSEFILIPEGRLTKRKVAEMLDSNQETQDVLIYWSDFKTQINDVASMWTKVLLKGISMRIIVFLHKNERLPQKIMCLSRYPHFEIRKASKPPKATLSIIDGKETLISVTPSISPRGKPGLYVNNHGIVGLIQEYFETTWRNSKTIR